jgi:hypothetical protein
MEETWQMMMTDDDASLDKLGDNGAPEVEELPPIKNSIEDERRNYLRKSVDGKK